MKIHLKNLTLLGVLIAGTSLFPANRVTAQTFTTLHSFINSDGDYPYSALVLSSGTLYGTATLGGNPGIYNGAGTLFAVSANSTNFSIVYAFSNDGSPYTNSDGA